MCQPLYFSIREIINETQRFNKNQNINIQKRNALEQYKTFLDVLHLEGVEITFLTPSPPFNEQVFVRDIGFVIGDKMFVSCMRNKIRKKETNILIDSLHRLALPYYQFKNSIEGGDVIVDQNVVYIGRSSRTTVEGIREMQTVLPNYEIQEIQVKEPYLHLDCLLNVISSTEAIIYRPAFPKATLRMLEKSYDLIDITSEEQFALGTNVLCLGDKKIISDRSNVFINQKLTNRGYKVIELNFSEFRKSGGSFRCTSLPIVRSSC